MKNFCKFLCVTQLRKQDYISFWNCVSTTQIDPSDNYTTVEDVCEKLEIFHEL
jgi:hypothetical protein